jgi:hypothetical protein
MRFCRIQLLFTIAPLVSLFAFALTVSAAPPPFPNQPKSDALNALQKMKLGTINVKDKPEYPNYIADLASFAADRVVHPPYNGEEAKTKTNESIESLLDEVSGWCVFPKRGNIDETNNQIDNARVFVEKMDERIQYVMKNTVKRLEKVNAARMLTVVAKVPVPYLRSKETKHALVDSLLKMIRDPQHPDEVKLYLFQALGNVLSAVDVKDPTLGVIQDPDKLAEVCKELDTIITTNYAAPKLQGDELLQWGLVTQYIRREAVRAMAQVKNSVVRDRQRQPIARPLWTLLRVARGDTTISPPYSESERIEALIGVCLMRPDDLVNLDTVAFYVSQSLLELGDYHNQQRAQFVNNPRYKPTIAWKLYGYRLSDALKQLKANAEKLPPNKGQPVVKLVDAALTRFVSKMEVEGIMAVPDAQPLVSWQSTNKPKSNQVFTDDRQ